jgi:hypothetical protein
MVYEAMHFVGANREAQPDTRDFLFMLLPEFQLHESGHETGYTKKGGPMGPPLYSSVDQRSINNQHALTQSG